MNESNTNRDAQVMAQPETAHAAQIDGRIKELHTVLPGIVHSFDPVTQTAEVQPAIKRIFTERGATNLPLCVDVPVYFPAGGDFVLTFPVRAGDECTLHFSERAIDYWFANGGVQLPSEYRLHDLSDAFAFVGVSSQPRKLGAVNMQGAELRTRDGSTFVRVENGTIRIKGNIVHEGDMTSTGTISGAVDVVGGGKSVKGHKHGGIAAGGSQTSTPL